MDAEDVSASTAPERVASVLWLFGPAIEATLGRLLARDKPTLQIRLLRQGGQPPAERERSQGTIRRATFTQGPVSACSVLSMRRRSSPCDSWFGPCPNPPS